MYEYVAEVTRHIDGDTIELNIDLGFGIWLFEEKVRLAGIDTPEIRTKNEAEKAAGMLALERVKELAPVGCQVVLQSTEFNKDKYGRIVGYVINSQGQGLGGTLLDEGLAEPYKG